jgi:hypothetical protein
MDAEIATVVNESWPYVTAVLGGYGAAVYKATQDQAAEATLSLGRRLVQRILGQREETVLAQLRAAGDEDRRRELFEAAVETALTASAQLAAEVRDLIAAERAPRGEAHVSGSTFNGPAAIAGTINGDVNFGS